MTPYFSNFNDFIAMGGHGAYVWASYALTFACIIGLILYSRSQRNAMYRDINTQQARHTQRQKRH
ncbi:MULTISPECIES: heme exporter protein CcmD [unclassified Moraxella]|uniref:heme exporter protein CcmD n=1 Tax=unclassified Moraxella TaxID=2685852 RepID=UPI003AF804D8